MGRLSALLESIASRGPMPCIVDAGAEYTYAELAQAVQGWRAEFARLAVSPRQVVAVRADYCTASIASLLALLTLKAVAALVPRRSNADMDLEDVRASALLDIQVDGTWSWQSRPAAPSHPLLRRLEALGDGGIVLLTSGSSGRPKAALQSTERFLRKFDKPGRALRTLAFLLFDHVAGLDTLFYTLSHGGALVLTRHRSPDAVAACIQSAGVEVLPASPSFLRLLCMSGAPQMPTLRVITYGSEPMDQQTLSWLNERYPNAEIAQKYGTTETGSPRTVSRSRDSLWLKFRSDDIETRVLDGVLWIKSESTILGYLNAPSPIDADGWYCTGDLVETDGEWLRFRGRGSDTINVGGEKVDPAEVEQAILELDFVRRARVSKEPHVLMGSIVVAQVELESADPQQAIRQIRQHCRSKLARHKVPVKIDVVGGGLVNERQKLVRASGTAAPA
jgi:long-chain acyl-CoA synthetase